ncbi:hypothetical protein AB0M45_08975 [Nocardia sp. NPDC051787]|uniref:hypothetical protein n=1 Tax=Nocardia sp. NPDC051787 TaxID=3155415 RepID=UPI0034382AAB
MVSDFTLTATLADAVPDRIAELVYIDTFVPRDGEAVADIMPGMVEAFTAAAAAPWLPFLLRHSRRGRSARNLPSPLSLRKWPTASFTSN